MDNTDYAMQRKIRRFLRDNKEFMTRQQLKTIDGQIKSGDINGAIKGIETIFKRQMKW